MAHIADGDILKFAWKSLGANLGTLLLAMLLSAATIGVPAVLFGILSANLDSDLIPAVTFVYMLIMLALSMIISVGWTNIAIKAGGGQKIEVFDIYKPIDRFLPFLGATILVALITLGGFILFIIPGIIWGLKYSLTPYYVIDKKMGVMDALRASANATMGLKWDLLGFSILINGLVFLSMIPLYIGLVVTIPMMYIAMGKIYKEIG